MNKSYLISKAITLPASGQPMSVDVSGSFVRCYQATAGQFEMSFDGSQWFEFEKGLRFKLVAGENYTRLWFRILSGTTIPNTVSFYYGTAEVEDNRLNIIDNEEAATLYIRPALVAPNFSPDFQVAMANGDAQVLPGGQAYFDIDCGSGDPDRSIEVFILNLASETWNRIARVVRGIGPRRFDFSESFRIENNSGASLNVSLLTYHYV